MKKLIVFALLVISGILWTESRADNSFTAPYNFKIVLGDPATTEFVISFSDSNDIGPDSISVVDGSDSTMYEYETPPTTQTSDTLTGLNPHTQHDLMLRTVRGDSIHVSNLDTLYTAWPQIESARPYEQKANLQLQGARAWRRADRSLDIRYDTLYISESTGFDSTMVYNVWKYTSAQIKMVGDVDSCKTLFMLYSGDAEETNILRQVSTYNTDLNTGSRDFHIAASDSLNVTKLGWTEPWQLLTGISRYFYIRADGQTDNGQATKAIIRLTRRKDND